MFQWVVDTLRALFVWLASTFLLPVARQSVDWFQKNIHWVLQWGYDLVKPLLDRIWELWPTQMSIATSDWAQYQQSLNCVNKWVPVSYFGILLAAYWSFVMMLLGIKWVLRLLPGTGWGNW